MLCISAARPYLLGPNSVDQVFARTMAIMMLRTELAPRVSTERNNWNMPGADASSLGRAPSFSGGFTPGRWSLPRENLKFPAGVLNLMAPRRGGARSTGQPGQPQEVCPSGYEALHRHMRKCQEREDDCLDRRCISNQAQEFHRRDLVVLV